MKLVYVISMGHSGSTLLDCILGTHPDFVSSGEMTYLQWQLERTKGIKPSVKAQDICTCENDFRDCPFWSQVFSKLKEKTGIDIVENPTAFDTAFFGKFAFKDRQGFKRSLSDKVKGYLVRNWIERGWGLDKIMWLEPRMKEWIKNSWLLYETMAEVADKPIVVDSSKDLVIALLLQQSRPEDVTLLFLHRDILGLAASSKKYGRSPFDPVEAKKTFEKRVKKYKANLKKLNYFDINYETLVSKPHSFLSDFVARMGAHKEADTQTDEEFYIDPGKLHIVAGNPMRYRGRKKVNYDDTWKSALSEEEISEINKQMR